jgi:hypothetical protein
MASTYLSEFIILIPVSHVSSVEIALIASITDHHALLIRFSQISTHTVLTCSQPSFNWGDLLILIVIYDVEEAVAVTIHFIFSIK